MEEGVNMGIQAMETFIFWRSIRHPKVYSDDHYDQAN